MSNAARPLSSSAHLSSTTDTASPLDAANDGRPADPLPIFVLTPELRARIAREAAKLPPGAVKPMGSYASDQIRWAGGLLATAWGDLPELVGIPIGDDAPLSRDELIVYGERLEYARETVTGAAPLDDDPKALSDDALQRALRGAHIALSNAIPLYLCGRVDEGAEQTRATCRTIRADKAKKSMSEHGARLNLLLDSTSALAPWLGRLPKGEAAAIDALRRLHPEWVRREQIASGNAPPVPSDEGADRAWGSLTKTRERILTAGRYLVSGRPDRDGAYRAFARPTPRKARASQDDAKRGDTKGAEAPATRKAPDAPSNDATKPVIPSNDATKPAPVTG